MTCQERKDLMLLYVTGALEPAEMAVMRDHLLGGCPACAGSLAEAEATMHQVPLSLPLRAAPESAWEKLEMRIALKEQAEGAGGAMESRRIARMAIPAPRRNAFAWAGWSAAAAVAILMGVLLRGANVRENDALAKWQSSAHDLAFTEQALLASTGQTSKLATRVADLEEKMKALDTEHGKLLVALDEARQDFMNHLDKLMHADQFAIAPHDMPGVTGTLFWNKADATWTLMASHLKPAPAGKTYELWIITTKGDKIAAGTFNPDPAGKAMHEIPLPPDLGPLAAAAVTDEPVGGVQSPTGHIQFLSDVSKTQ